MSNLGQELSNLDMGVILGGPMTALVQAQTQTALATADFVQKVGFDENGNPVEVDFNFNKVQQNDDGTETVVPTTLRVPLLSIVQIPSIRISEGSIELNIKLNSTYAAANVETQKSGANADVQAGGGVAGPGYYGYQNVRFTASTANQSISQSGTQTSKSYSMNVKINIVQDELPAGLEKVLNMLEEQIRTVPPSE